MTETPRPIIIGMLAGLGDSSTLMRYIEDLSIILQTGPASILSQCDIVVLDNTTQLPPGQNSTVIRVPENEPLDQTWWIASRLRRTLRRVPEYEELVPKGIERLLIDGHFETAEGAPLSEIEGVLLLKPGTRVTTSTLSQLGERCAECGYLIRRARKLSGAEVKAGNKIRQHYLVQDDIYRHGILQPAERVRLMNIYDKPEFRERFHRPPADVEVVPAEVLIKERGVPEDLLKSWNESLTETQGLDGRSLDGPHKIGDNKYATLFHHADYNDGQPVFLLNPHMITVAALFESPEAIVFAFHLQGASERALSWNRLREEFCGAADPSRAMPGSLRGDSLKGCFDLPQESGRAITQANNGVHLSKGLVGAVREISIWFDTRPSQTTTGKLLTLSGVEPEELISRPYINYMGRQRSLSALTDGLERSAALDILRKGKLIARLETSCWKQTVAHIDVGLELALALQKEPGALAVIATGSAARGRAFKDSDLDLIILADSKSGVGGKIECVSHRNVRVELNWLSVEQANKLVSNPAPSQKELREASRIGMGVPLWDPWNLYEALASKANTMLPDKDDMARRLSSAVHTLASIARSGDSFDSASQWESLRTIADNVAFILLSLHPIRYQKAKWVVDDLSYIGEEQGLRALVDAYGVRRTNRDRVEEVVSLTQRFLSQIGDLNGYPSYQEVLENGFAPEWAEFSYACRALDDAFSLAKVGLHEQAMYTAMFAGKLAVSIFAAEATHTQGSVFPHELLSKHAPEIWPLYREIAYGRAAKKRPTRETFARCAEAVVRGRERFEECYSDEKTGGENLDLA